MGGLYKSYLTWFMTALIPAWQYTGPIRFHRLATDKRKKRKKKEKKSNFDFFIHFTLYRKKVQFGYRYNGLPSSDTVS